MASRTSVVPAIESVMGKMKDNTTDQMLYPVARAETVVGDRWIVLILREIFMRCHGREAQSGHLGISATINVQARKRSTPMPFVRIDLKRGKSADYRKTLGEIVYKAMIDLINVPQDDKFQVITEHDRDDLNYAESYLGNRYSEDVVFVQITLNSGRSVELKKAFYKRIADDFQNKLNGRPDDVVINLIEVPKENWSFGQGIAQYA